MVEVGANVARLQGDMRTATSIVSSSAQRMEGAFASVSKTFSMIGGAVGGLAVGSMFKDMGAAVVEAGMKAQQLDNAFKAITGSTSGAKQQLDFVRETSDRLGISFNSAADSFKNISAAARNTALEGKGVQEVFTAVAEAGTVMGLSKDKMNSAFVAIAQMMGKGKVQAEEFTQQLGEHLPMALQVTSREMGMTTAEFLQFLSTGKAMATDVLPAMARGLHASVAGSVGDAAKSAQAEFNRFENATTELKTELSNGLLPIITDVTRGMVSLIKSSKEAGQAIKALEGVHQIGVEIQFRSNAAAVRAEVVALNKEMGIGESAIARGIDDIVSRFKESPKSSLSDWGNILWGPAKDRTHTGGFRMLESASVPRQISTDMENTYRQIAESARKINAIKQEIYEGVPSGSGSPVGGGGGRRGGGGGGSGKSWAAQIAEENRHYFEIMKTQADAIAQLYEEINGAAIGGDAGIKTGGVFNEMASRRYEEFQRLNEALRENANEVKWLEDVWASASQAMEGAFVGLIMGTKTSWHEMIQSMIADLSRLVLRMAILDPVGKWLGGLIGGGSGGAATAADASARSIAGGAPTINVTVNHTPGLGGSPDPHAAKVMGGEVARLVNVEVVRILQQQQRDGGVLSRGIRSR